MAAAVILKGSLSIPKKQSSGAMLFTPSVFNKSALLSLFTGRSLRRKMLTTPLIVVIFRASSCEGVRFIPFSLYSVFFYE